MSRGFGAALALVYWCAGVAEGERRPEFEEVCGDSAVESVAFVPVAGVVTKIVDGDTIGIKRADSGKTWIVELAGVGAVESNDLARLYLLRKLLNKKVTVVASPATVFARPDEKNSPPVEAVIVRKGSDVNRFLVESGFARFRNIDSDYAAANYSTCVLIQLEAKANSSKLGIWARR